MECMAYPTEPNQGSAQTHLASREEALDMHPHLSKREPLLAVSRDRASPAFDLTNTASLHRLQRERTRAVVLLGDELQRLNNLSIAAFADKILRRLLQSDDRHPSDGHGEDQRSTRKPNIAPAGVRFPIASYTSLGLWSSTGEVRQEGPCKLILSVSVAG